MITSGYERSAPDTPHPPTPAAQLQPAAISGTSSRIGAVPVPANGHTTSPHKRCAQAPTPINFDHPVSTGPFPRSALRTGRARFRASGSPQVPSGFRLTSCCARPRAGNPCSPVEVSHGAHPGRVEQFHIPSGGPPSIASVAATELLPSAVPVFAAQPSKDPLPSIGPQVVEGRAGTAVSEVGGPAPQKPVEPDQQDVERPVRVLPADRLYLGLGGVQRRLGRIDVDVVRVAGSPLPLTLDAPAKEVEALVDMGNHGLFRRQAQTHRR